jgi:hypothetical protein
LSVERIKTGNFSIARDLVVEVVKNLLMGSPAFRRWRLRKPRTAFGDDIDAFLANNAFTSLSLLLKYGGDPRGKSVCEIGAGDYLTSGLAMLGAGAARYGVIDRFPGDYFGDTAKRWYREIELRWSKHCPSIEWNNAISAEGFPEDCSEILELVGEPLETAKVANRYDIVCSFQVGEHVSDIDSFAEIHNRVLTENGFGLHRVDFGPHGVWFEYADPGTFLRFSDNFWKKTGSNRGVPNRKRHHEFLEAFKKANLNVDILFLDNFDRSAMDLTKLDRKFLEMPLDSVLTGTAIYRLTKNQELQTNNH